MKTACILAVVAGLASGAAASFETAISTGVAQLNYGTGEWSYGVGGSEAINGTTYSNVNVATTTFTRNRITAGALAQPAGTTVIMGDSVNQVAGAAGGIIDEIRFSVVNGNSAAAGNVQNVPAGEVQAVVAFWNNPGALNGTIVWETAPLLGAIAIDLPQLNSLFGGTYTVSGLSGLNIAVTQNMFMGVFFRDNAALPGNFALAASNYGQLVSNQGATIGASDNATFFRDRLGDGVGAADGLFGFAAPTVSNFNYEIKTIPTPGALAVLGLGGLVAGRRRR